jgi:hypothetical protein
MQNGWLGLRVRLLLLVRSFYEGDAGIALTVHWADATLVGALNRCQAEGVGARISAPYAEDVCVVPVPPRPDAAQYTTAWQRR